VLDDELTLLDGTEVISVPGVIKITGGRLQASDLLASLQPATILEGAWYFDRAEVLRLFAAVR
jgi:hypothetical protein